MSHAAAGTKELTSQFAEPKAVWQNVIMHRGAINGDRAFVYNVKAHNADDFGR